MPVTEQTKELEDTPFTVIEVVTTFNGFRNVAVIDTTNQRAVFSIPETVDGPMKGNCQYLFSGVLFGSLGDSHTPWYSITRIKNLDGSRLWPALDPTA